MLNAIAPDFQKFPILIKASEAEKNFLAKQEGGEEGEAKKPSGPKEKKPDRLYVGNLHVHITEEDLQQVFAPFGDIDNVSVVRDEMGGSKGYAFVKFARVEDAKVALEKLTSIGLVLMDKPIKVSHTNDTMGIVAPKAAASSATESLDDMGQKTSGMPMNSQTRAALMAKLGASAGIAPPSMPGMAPGAMPPGMGMPMGGGVEAAKAMAAQASGMVGGMPGVVAPGVAAAAPGGVPSGPTVMGQPSFCFMIRNMFDPATETEPGWDQDIKEDVESECSKFGAVLHCYVEARQPGGLVYLLFSTTPMAQQAAQSLGGRWFAGRMITCEFLNPDRYAGQFPEAAQGVATAKATAANMGGY